MQDAEKISLSELSSVPYTLENCGEDAANAHKVVYDDLYASVLDAAKAATQPLVVVAHSFAGLIAARVCEEMNDRIDQVYYLAAWLPSEGKSLLDLALGYNNSELPSIFIDCGNPKLRAVEAEGAKRFFYHDCLEEDQAWAASRLRPKALHLDLEKMPRVVPTHSLEKSTYILCEHDRAVNPISQRDMAQRFGFSSQQIVAIPSGHSPFLSMPHKLAELIA